MGLCLGIDYNNIANKRFETRTVFVSLNSDGYLPWMRACTGIKKAELVKQQHVQLGQAQVDFVNSDGELARGCREK